jgi:hypothetical protein
MTTPLGIAPMVAGVRMLAVAASLVLWFWTQRLISQRGFGPAANPGAAGGAIFDGLHHLTAGINRRLNAQPRQANTLLISSSLVIDLLGFYLLGSSILGHTIEPFLGLLMLFALRQFCQALCPLPAPAGMIWRNPGCPSVLVTYGTSNDLFFSGHTAIAVFGAVTLASTWGPAGIAIGTLIAVFEISAVLVLRAHYTMDVFTGAVTALYVHRLAMDLAPTVDGWIAHAAAMVTRV